MIVLETFWLKKILKLHDPRQGDPETTIHDSTVQVCFLSFTPCSSTLHSQNTHACNHPLEHGEPPCIMSFYDYKE